MWTHSGKGGRGQPFPSLLEPLAHARHHFGGIPCEIIRGIPLGNDRLECALGRSGYVSLSVAGSSLPNTCSASHPRLDTSGGTHQHALRRTDACWPLATALSASPGRRAERRRHLDFHVPAPEHREGLCSTSAVNFFAGVAHARTNSAIADRAEEIQSVIDQSANESSAAPIQLRVPCLWLPPLDLPHRMTVRGGPFRRCATGSNRSKLHCGVPPASYMWTLFGGSAVKTDGSWNVRSGAGQGWSLAAWL